MRFLFAAIVCSLAVGNMAAAASVQYDLVADFKGNNGAFKDGFSLSFEDKDNDKLFSIDELIPSTFSGVSYYPGGNIEIFFDVLSRVPTIPSVSDGNFVGFYLETGPNAYAVNYGYPLAGLDTIAYAGQFNFSVTERTQSISTVPVPGAVLMLTSSLAALLGMARRRQKFVSGVFA